MKLGILQCDSVLDEYRPQFDDYPQMFMRLFSAVRPDLEYEIFDVKHGQFPSTLGQCDAYISTGSRDSVYDKLTWLPPFKDFIWALYEHNIKLIGVCFAHQFIADIFGGKTERSEKGWGIGVATNQVIKKMSWMQPELDQYRVIVSHQDQVISLPENAILLASSEFCPNFMFQISNNILTIQGHPEFSKSYSETLMLHRSGKIGEPACQNGLVSLKQATDEIIIAKWILNFVSMGQV